MTDSLSSRLDVALKAPYPASITGWGCKVTKATSRWSEEYSLECNADSSLDFNLPARSR